MGALALLYQHITQKVTIRIEGLVAGLNHSSCSIVWDDDHRLCLEELQRLQGAKGLKIKGL